MKKFEAAMANHEESVELLTEYSWVAAGQRNFKLIFVFVVGETKQCVVGSVGLTDPLLSILLTLQYDVPAIVGYK